MYGAQKAICTSHRDEENLLQLPEIAAGKKSSLKIPDTVAVHPLPLLHPLHSISLYISLPLSLLPLISLILLRIHTLLPRRISSFSLPPFLLILSFSFCPLPPPFFPPRNTFPGEILGPSLGCCCLLAGVVSRQIKNG